MIIDETIKNTLPIITTLVTALFTYWFGSRIYYKQKEYELVRQRYLEMGIDLLIKNLEHALVVFRNNWTQSLAILKEFRDVGKYMKQDSYSQQFMKFDHHLFIVTPFQRIDTLIGDRIFWPTSQSLFAFVQNANNFFERDFCNAIRLCIEKHDEYKNARERVLKDSFHKLHDLENQSHKYYAIIQELLNIASVLEKEKFLFRRLRRLKEHNEVKLSIQRMKEVFLDELGTYKKGIKLDDDFEKFLYPKDPSASRTQQSNSNANP